MRREKISGSSRLHCCWCWGSVAPSPSDCASRLPSIWTTFFGSGFGIAGKYDLPYLLSLYAVTTIVYTLSVVMITYEMSYKIANTSWVQLAFSGVVIAGICEFHSSLRQVIMVQLILMIGLLISVALPFLISSLTIRETCKPAALVDRSGQFGACRKMRSSRSF